MKALDDLEPLKIALRKITVIWLREYIQILGYITDFLIWMFLSVYNWHNITCYFPEKHNCLYYIEFF